MGKREKSKSGLWRPTRGPILLYRSDQIRPLPAKRKRIRVYNRFSHFKKQLIERKKFTILYGNLTKKQLKRACYRASQGAGRRNEQLLLLLEARLDVVLYRISFFKTIHSARQSINHNRITVNGQTVNLSSYAVKPGDVMSVTPKRWGGLETKRRGVDLSSCWCGNHKPRRQPACCTFAPWVETGGQARGLASLSSRQRPSPVSLRYNRRRPGRVASNNPLPAHLFLSKVQVVPFRPGYKQVGSAVLLCGQKTGRMACLPVSTQGGKRERPAFGLRLPLTSLSLKPLTLRFKPFVKRLLELNNLLTKGLNLKVSGFRGVIQRIEQEGLLALRVKERTLVPLLGIPPLLHDLQPSLPFIACSTFRPPQLQLPRLRDIPKVGFQPLSLRLRRRRPHNPSPYPQLLSIHLRRGGIKLLHLEVSYRLLTAIFLYSPQKVPFAGNLDLNLVVQSLR